MTFFKALTVGFVLNVAANLLVSPFSGVLPKVVRSMSGLPLMAESLYSLQKGYEAPEIKGKPIEKLHGLPVFEMAAITHLAYNTDGRTLTGHASLDDRLFLKYADELMFADDSSFKVTSAIQGKGFFEKADYGGLNAVTFRHKAKQKNYLVVVGLESDNILRDGFTDIGQVMFRGMQDQTRVLLKKTTASPDVIVGHSMGTIPAYALTVVQYLDGNPAPMLAMEGRVVSDELVKHIHALLKEFRPDLSASTDTIKKILKKQVTLMNVSGNAWNTGRMTRSGESEAIPMQTLLLHSDEHQASKNVFLSMLDLTFLGEHRSNIATRGLAMNGYEVYKTSYYPASFSQVLNTHTALATLLLGTLVCMVTSYVLGLLCIKLKRIR